MLSNMYQTIFYGKFYFDESKSSNMDREECAPEKKFVQKEDNFYMHSCTKKQKLTYK